MKIKITGMIAATIFSIVCSNFAVAADTPLWRCAYTMFKKSDGSDAFERYSGTNGFFLRTGHKDLAVLGNSASSLQSMHVLMTEEEACGGPDSCSTYGHAVGSSSGTHNDFLDGQAFYNSDDDNQGLRFGDGKVLGFISCHEVMVHSYYVTPEKVVFIPPGEHSSDNFGHRGNEIFQKIVGVPSACAGGDMNAVADDIKNGRIFFGAEYSHLANVAVSTDGKSVTWTIIQNKCVKTVYVEDERGGGDICVQEEEVSRRNFVLPGCGSI